MINSEIALELKSITKSFFGLKACDNISLQIKKGEVHALLGENGAGKSTLMNIINGLYIPEQGEILVDGKLASIKSPKDSIDLGIGMVHQHYRLVETLNVVENIVIGLDRPRWLVNWGKLAKDVEALSLKYNLPVDPFALISDLSVGEKQKVEIVKMLYRGVDILILDEPTSVLTPQESEQLFINLRQMKANGKTIIFISHKLNEVMDLADRITVIRKGQVEGTLEKSSTTREKLVMMMVGREMKKIKGIPYIKKDCEPVLIAKDLKAIGKLGEVALDGVSFELYPGEIMGIAGVSGNGQSQLAEVLTGLWPLKSGRMIFKGSDLTGKDPFTFNKAGIGHIPEDRIGVGIIPNFSCTENIILKNQKEYSKFGKLIIDKKKAEDACVKLMADFDVRAGSPRVASKVLSGGNIQKLILSREISRMYDLLIAVHPTYGLDISAVELIHRFLLEEQKRGASILLISEDLDEIFEIASTISVIFKGKLTPKRNRKDWSIEELGQNMMGLNLESVI